VHPDQVVLTASSSEAYAYLFKLLCDPRDHVLVPRPSYPLFEFLAGLESVEVASYPLRYDGEWHLSADALREAIGPRTRAIVVVHPNNPTGSFLKADEAAALEVLAAEHGLAVVSDEVFADYAFGPDRRRVATLARDGPCLTFTLGGLSKSCALPQLKLGWIVASGPHVLRTEALARLEVIADTYLSVGTPVQEALPSILARRAELHAPVDARVRSNRDDLARRLGRGSAASLLHAEGGWAAVLRLPALPGEEDWAVRLLVDADVLVHPGYFFDFEGEGFVVASLLTPPGILADGASRILASVGRA
jgi:aspartate/methionine/tyrosine aminotransferase